MRKSLTIIAITMVLVIPGHWGAQVIASHFTCCAVAVNTVTNRVYFLNQVIDGATNMRIATLPRTIEFGVGVNRVTNRIYISGHYTDELYVIDGVTHQEIAVIPFDIWPPWLPDEPVGVAVDSARNLVHVLTYLDGGDTIINGQTNEILRHYSTYGEPWKVAVNEATGCAAFTLHYEIKIASYNYSTGQSGCAPGVDFPDIDYYGPSGIAWNETTGDIYVTVYDQYNAVDPDVLATSTGNVAVGKNPEGVAYNPTTNRIYVATQENGGTIWILDGTTHQLLRKVPGGGFGDIAVNPVTNRAYVSASKLIAIYDGELLMNPGFDGDLDGNRIPDGWTARHFSGSDGLTTEDGYTAANAFAGRWAVRITGAAGANKQLSQTVATTGPAGTVLKLEGFSKAEGTSGSGAYQIRAQVFYTDGKVGQWAVSFTRSTHDWERRYATFTAAKPFTKVSVTVRYTVPTGTAWFDALHLWVGP